MSPHDVLAHLEAENARLEADNAALLHQKHQAEAERDRARSVAVNLEQELDLERHALDIVCTLLKTVLAAAQSVFDEPEEPHAPAAD